MTAQTTTQRTASGVRIAPMIVVLIAIIAFASGLAIAEIAVPALTTSVSPVAAAPVGTTVTTDRRAYDGIAGSSSVDGATLVATAAGGAVTLAGRPTTTDRRAYDGDSGSSSAQDAQYLTAGRNR